ncbi:MAG: single-stranded DNA-binding protein [Caldilineaceae bacterium]
MYNSTTLVGHVGMIQSKQTSTGVPVTSFSLAVNKKFTKADGTSVETCLWVRITAWRKLAEIANQIIHKGDLVLIEGTLEAPSVYTAKDGKPAASIEITADRITKLSKKDEHVAPAAPQTANIPAGEMEEEAVTIPMGSSPF